MESVPKFYQVGKSHYNLEQIVKITSGSDLSSVLVSFSDGSKAEFKFETEDEYAKFIYLIRSINF